MPLDEFEQERYAVLTPSGVELHVVGIDGDPRISPGMAAPVGSLGMGPGASWVKYGSSDTSWARNIGSLEF